jgi:hypothetical protein
MVSINKNIEEKKKKTQEEYARAIKPFIGRKKCHEGS